MFLEEVTEFIFFQHFVNQLEDGLSDVAFEPGDKPELFYGCLYP
jgi:hypothetical protein